MAAPALARWGGMLLLASVLSPLSRGPCWAGEPVFLRADYSDAVTKARREGRLLFVLHLSGDFTADTVLGEEGEGYRSLALSDDRVSQLLKSRFVATFRQVGMPASLSFVSVRGKLKPAEPERQHAIAYICLPDERVIHFIPGFVTADQLLAELTWAEGCYFDFVRFPANEQPLAVRQWHLAAADPADVELFSKTVNTRWLLDDPVREASRDDLATIVQGARHFRTTRLDARFAGPRNALPMRAFYDALADHAGLETAVAHLVLAEHPLVPLAQLAEPLYEVWFRDHFWQLGPRRDQVKDWYLDRVGKGRPVLLAVAAEQPPLGEPPPRQLFSWPPSKADDVPLSSFDVLELSLAEVTVLIGDLGLPPLTAQRHQLPRFLVLDRAGRRRAVLTTSDGISKLRTAMRASAQPGVAAASDKGKGRRDER